MFERLSNSWALVKASAAVLRADKELLIFPIISALLSILVVATFAIPTFLAGLFDASIIGRDGIPIAGYIIAFVFYLVQYFVIFFCNTALVGAALIRLRGGDPTVGDGFRIAAQRFASILGYALLSATVGMILRALAERGGALGRIVSSLFGLAWNLATYLAVPVLAAENVGPIEAVKRSANYLKRTWGEQIVGSAGIGLVFGLIFVFVILFGVGVFILAAALQSGVVFIALLALLVFTLIGLGLINAALSGIYAAAVYRYAAEGVVSERFDAELVQHAFRAK